MKRSINHYEIIDLPNGKRFELDIEATVVKDPDYGSDADGNRGEVRYTVEDTVILNSKQFLEALLEDRRT